MAGSVLGFKGLRRVGEGAFIRYPLDTYTGGQWPVYVPMLFLRIFGWDENVGCQTSSGGATGSFAESAAVRLNRTRKLPVD